MCSKCANSNCATPFDYRRGRIFRFGQSHPESQGPANTQGMRHFWLCKECSETYTLEYRKGLGVLIHSRFKVSSDEHVPRLIAAA